MIDATRQAFANHDVIIAEVGAWANLLDVDPQMRKKNFSFVSERLAVADELGARCCVDLAGSYNPTIWYGPDKRNITQEFLDATVENVRKLIDGVKPKRTKFSIEMSPWNIPSGPDEYLSLIKAIDRKAFGAHVDITNIINSPYRMYRNGEVIQDCLQKLAPWVVSCHAKDLKWEVGLPDTVRFREVVPGLGMIDFKSCVQAMSKLPNDVPLMIEHLASEQEYNEGREYIQDAAHSVGLSFGPARRDSDSMGENP
jgi:sugar phosphate isomerase/epimerase